MNTIKLSEDLCRICLKQNLKINWNEEILECCGISYKDCYYKYTNLEEFDSDCFPTNLCEICANALKNAHLLFQKALESFNVLQAFNTTEEIESKYSDLSNCCSLPTMKCDAHTFDEAKSPIDNKELIDIDEICLPLLCGDNREAVTENMINAADQISASECVTVEPIHFVDIRNFESSAETTLEKQLNDISNMSLYKKTRKLQKCRKTYWKKKKRLSLEPVLNESCNAKLSKSFCKKESKKCRNLEALSGTLLEQQINNFCDTEIPKSSASKMTTNETEILLEQYPNESSNRAATKAKKLRKKPFMCAYCSLKMDTAAKLETHEATHNENRKRTETCPQCGIKLFTKLSLREHMKTHDENRKKNHKCEFCGNAFYNRGSLNVHRRIHLGLMVKCHICQKEYFRQVDLDKHLISHSEAPIQKNVGKKKYTVQCQYCNKSIVTVKWKAHLAAHLDQPQVQCKICEKNFFSRTNCSNHLRRFHLKTATEYEDFIHYYDRKTRVSILMMKQQLSAQPLIENKVP